MDIQKFNALSLLNVPNYLRADPAGKNAYLLTALVSAEVLTELNCCHSDLIARYNENPELFIIRLGDLTEKGLAFGRTGFQRWLENTDRWTGERTKEKYKASLLKQWVKFNEKTP